MKTSNDGVYAFFGDMTWPVPSGRFNVAEYRLRHGEATREDVLLAASVMAAYRQMVADPEENRRGVIRGIREAMSGASVMVKP